MNVVPPLVLASASPRRAELLRSIGARFAAEPADVDETPQRGERGTEYVVRLAGAKAGVAAGDDRLVVGADTTVVVDDEILGKPADRGDARRMLRRLSGRAHEVHTGLAVAAPPAPDRHAVVVTACVTTHVWLADLDATTIDWYVDTGEPLDKAGGYGIQGAAGLFVLYLHGSYQNVVGLPLADLDVLLGEVGHRLLDWVT
jgi:septum formation protein